MLQLVGRTVVFVEIMNAIAAALAMKQAHSARTQRVREQLAVEIQAETRHEFVVDEPVGEMLPGVADGRHPEREGPRRSAPAADQLPGQKEFAVMRDVVAQDHRGTFRRKDAAPGQVAKCEAPASMTVSRRPSSRRWTPSGMSGCVTGILRPRLVITHSIACWQARQRPRAGGDSRVTSINMARRSHCDGSFSGALASSSSCANQSARAGFAERTHRRASSTTSSL